MDTPSHRTGERGKEHSSPLTLDERIRCRSSEMLMLRRSLEKLSVHLREFNVVRIRVYRMEQEPKGAVLRSCGAVGHSDRETISLFSGAIVHSQVTSDPATSHSFWCTRLGVPTLLRIDSGTARPIQLIESTEHLPLVVAKQDCCNSFLGSRPGMYWMEVPTFVDGKMIGKLSCDFDEIDDPSLLPACLGTTIHRICNEHFYRI